MKKCLKCGTEKPLIDFGTRKRNSTGKRGRCKACESDDRKMYLSDPDTKSKVREKSRQWFIKNRVYNLKRHKEWCAKNKDRRQFSVRKRRLALYGITHEDYFRMLSEQGNQCKICGSLKPGRGSKHFYIDHCHKTSKVRGLLCAHCNMAIGQFSDNPETIRRAALYVDMQGEI